jgi:endonuclease VIII
MPEGDTIHRAARRMNAALGGREVELAEAPNPRSPLHRRAAELAGRRFERAEARGKHLLAHFSGGLVVHSHLGMNGRWWIDTEGPATRGMPWLRFGAGSATAAQSGGRLLRLVSESRARNDPGLIQLGPDPLREGFDVAAAARRLREIGADRAAGDALLDQTIVAGAGNAIKSEAFFLARIDPRRRSDGLSVEEAERLTTEARRVMVASLDAGRRPHWIYRGARRRCPRCGTRIEVIAQGDANRSTYWCPGCQA